MAMGLVSEMEEGVGIFRRGLMSALFQWGGKDDMAYERLHKDVTYGRITGPTIFSIRWEMASWPILLEASLAIAEAVLRLVICLKLKGAMFRVGG